ncbi:MAG: hypothetical protein WD096_09945 [Actinomycetota bacterium]
MSALEDLLEEWPDRDAAPVRRLVAIMHAKTEGYWLGHGRDRFGHELAVDGLDPAQIDAVLEAVDADLGVMLDVALARARARVSTEG